MRVKYQFQENNNGLHPEAQTVLMGIFKISVISKWQIPYHFEMSHSDSSWIYHRQNCRFEMIKPYPFEMMDDARFEMIDLISKWFAPCLFEMMGCFSLRYDGWLSLRNADGRLFEMRTRDCLPSVDYLNDSHISCHLRMILLQKRSSFRKDNNRKSLSKLCHFKRIDDFYSFLIDFIK